MLSAFPPPSRTGISDTSRPELDAALRFETTHTGMSPSGWGGILGRQTPADQIEKMAKPRP
jgi:hypothetical protein